MNQAYMKMLVPSTEECKESVLRAVRPFVEQMGATEEEIKEIRIGIVEAMDNCISHAYPGKVGPIFVSFKALKNNVLSVVIKDKGCGIQDVDLAMQPLFTTGDTNLHSGMGISVMETFMTDIKVISKVGKGTSVSMKKHIVS